MSDHFKNFDELFRDERDSSRPQRPAQQRPTRQAYASQWTDDAARPRRSAPDDRRRPPQAAPAPAGKHGHKAKKAKKPKKKKLSLIHISEPTRH